MSNLRRLHISNAGSRNAIVVGVGLTPPPSPNVGKNGEVAIFRRFITATNGEESEDFLKNPDLNFSEELISRDPEVDIELVGRFIEDAQSVLLSANGSPIFAAPSIVEISYDSAGDEVERHAPSDTLPTVNDSVPLRWTGKKMPIGEVVRRFAFRRSMQLRHVDGVTYDFLYAMAKELADEKMMLLLGAGETGKEPIVLQLNGSPYRGFLEGRIDGVRYKLLLHLSNMELRAPQNVKAGGDE